MKRIPANVSGGKSSRPSFMKSHVEPQMRHNNNQTSRDYIDVKQRERRTLPGPPFNQTSWKIDSLKPADYPA
jgi:hypothetical protein